MTEMSQQEVQAVEIQSAIAQVKGFVVYKFESKEIAHNVLETITEDVLSSNPFKPCGKCDQFKTGFTPFTGEGDNYILQTKGVTAFQVTEQYKKPKTITVKRKCKVEEAKYMKEHDVEKLDKESKDIIKMSVIENLLPTTDADEEKTTLMWVVGDSLIVGSPTYKKAEELVATVRNIIGSLPITPLDSEVDVAQKLTELLSKNYNEVLFLGKKVELAHSDPSNKGVITFAKESLYYAEVGKHIKEGCLVNKIQMSNDDLITFTLNTSLEFSGTKVNKDVLAGAKDLGAMIVTIDEINRCVMEVVDVLRG